MDTREIQIEFDKLAFAGNQAGLGQEWLDRMAALATSVRTGQPGQYDGMGPGGPSRASELVMNPANQEAKTARRIKLLEAFDGLDVNTRATLLGLAESWAFRATAAVNTDSYDARAIFRRIHASAGWEA